jgi:acyl-coenzyme A thioesterase 13
VSDAPEGFAPFDEHTPFLDLVGPVLVREAGDDERVFGLRIEERHLNHRGTAQGGLLATLVDFAVGRAIEAGLDGEAQQATVSLTTDFLGPVKEGAWLEAHAKVERLGSRLAFADCSLIADDREAVRGRAVFAVVSD